MLIMLIWACQEKGRQKQVSPKLLTRETLQERWNLLSPEEKRRFIQASGKSGLDAFADSLKKEYALACLAKKKGLDRLKSVKTRLEEAKNRVLFEELLRREAIHRWVTQADINKYYEQNKQRFFIPEEVKVSHILISPRKNENINNLTKSDRVGEGEAKAQIEKIRKMLDQGASFSELAKKYSEDTTAPNGGLIGWFGRNMMVKTFEEAAFSTKPGHYSDIIRTEYGYHILYVHAKRGGYFLTLQEVQRAVEAELILRHAQELEELRQALERQALQDKGCNPNPFGEGP